MSAPVLTGGVHAPRAVLATSHEFPDVPRSMAEYIWNGFQYRRDRTKPARVIIKFGKNSQGHYFEVSDFNNGAGMDFAGLQRFFTMHAPNEDRVKGDPGRGRNGTGKAAAFGVGSILEVYSVRDGIANEIVLRKADLEALESTYPCERLPLVQVKTNEPVAKGEPRFGTRIRVLGIRQPIDETTYVRNLTRQFQRVLDHNELIWQKSATDARRIVKPKHTAILSTKYAAPERIQPWVGKATLNLHAADVDLPRQECGVIITSVGGSVLEDNYINIVRRRSIVDKRIFGDIDVPLLDEPDEYGHHATTQARRLEMNRTSERVSRLLGWIDECVDDFREKVEEAVESETAEKDKAVLTAIANTLEKVLNEQYRQFVREYSSRIKLPKTQSGPFPDGHERREGAPEPTGEGEQVYTLAANGESKVIQDSAGPVQIVGPGANEAGGGSQQGDSTTSMGRLDDEGGAAEPKQRGPRKAKAGASLQITHVGVGATSPRAYYDGQGTFTINIDHPDFDGLEKRDPEFMRRCAEGVAVTYAQAEVEMRVKDADMTVQTPTDALNAMLDAHDRVLRPLLIAVGG